MNVGGGCVMTRKNQTDNSDKLYKEGVWNLLVYRPNQLAQSTCGSLSGFYGKVDRLLASVKMAQWAERYALVWQPAEAEVEVHVLLQPGNKAEKRQWKNLAPVAGLGQSVSSSQG